MMVMITTIRVTEVITVGKVGRQNSVNFGICFRMYLQCRKPRWSAVCISQVAHFSHVGYSAHRYVTVQCQTCDHCKQTKGITSFHNPCAGTKWCCLATSMCVNNFTQQCSSITWSGTAEIWTNSFLVADLTCWPLHSAQVLAIPRVIVEEYLYWLHSSSLSF